MSPRLSRRRNQQTSKETSVQNLLEKFSPEAEVEKGDEGMVLIEYVVFGGVIAAMITGG